MVMYQGLLLLRLLLLLDKVEELRLEWDTWRWLLWLLLWLLWLLLLLENWVIEIHWVIETPRGLYKRVVKHVSLRGIVGIRCVELWMWGSWVETLGCSCIVALVDMVHTLLHYQFLLRRTPQTCQGTDL
jgi:hypothetical protein